MSTYKLGFIGCGNMGFAILKGMIDKKVMAPSDVYVYELAPQAIKNVQDLGANIAADETEVAKASDIVVLAVKPKDASAVLARIKDVMKDKALVSIVAGVFYEDIHSAIGAQVRVLTVLPNTPVQVGEGVTGFTNETTLNDEEKQFVQTLFESVGIVEWVPEKLLPVVSAISGSGPAYVALFIEALGDGGVLNGLPREAAYRLAAQTVKGTGAMLIESGIHPGEAKDRVCSPGGTTIEAVKELEKNGFRYCVINAVHRCVDKFFKLS